MQNSGASSHISNNGGMYCSTSTLSDTGSWDTDFDDDQNSESSGFYGDVGPSVALEKTAPEVQSKSSGVGRVAALAKTVAASLAASGHSGSSKFHKAVKKNVSVSSETTNSDVPGHSTNQRFNDSSPKTLSKPTNRPGLSTSLFPVPIQHGSFRNDKPTLKEKILFPSGNNGNKGNVHTGLPKPPGPESEQVQQVIGALGHLWSSDSISLSSQTQSDDDYEPMQSDSSPQMARLSPHPKVNGSHFQEDSLITSSSYPNESFSSIPGSHSNSVVQSFLHSSPRNTSDHAANLNVNQTLSKSSQQGLLQSAPFLHSSAAAAALAAVAASAAACRLSQCSKRSSGCDSVYSPSSGSSISETVLQSPNNAEGVYEPIEEKQKNLSQTSFLHSKKLAEKCDMKSPGSNVKASQTDSRPPVPNRPLPPTPRPAPEKPAGDTSKGGLLAVNLDHHPWFHSVDRRQAEELIKNGIDGYFLIRPSSQSQNPLTLTLWYNQRVYNISIRLRKDGRIALGFEKPDEQSFSSIEEMVQNYHSENLLLFSRNERTGRTVLTKSPPKKHVKQQIVD